MKNNWSFENCYRGQGKYWFIYSKCIIQICKNYVGWFSWMLMSYDDKVILIKYVDERIHKLV